MSLQATIVANMCPWPTCQCRCLPVVRWLKGKQTDSLQAEESMSL